MKKFTGPPGGVGLPSNVVTLKEVIYPLLFPLWLSCRRPIMLRQTFLLSWRGVGQAVWPECWGWQVLVEINYSLSNQPSGRSSRTHLKPGVPDDHKRLGAQLGERSNRRWLGRAARWCLGSWRGSPSWNAGSMKISSLSVLFAIQN